MAQQSSKAKGGKERKADQGAARGNARVARAAFIRERMQQTGCLAIEAARAFEAGAR